MISRTREERVTLRRCASFVSVAWSSAGNLTLRTFMGEWRCIRSQKAVREYIIYFSQLMTDSSSQKVLIMPASTSDTGVRTAPVVHQGQALPSTAGGTQLMPLRVNCHNMVGVWLTTDEERDATDA